MPPPRWVVRKNVSTVSNGGRCPPDRDWRLWYGKFALKPACGFADLDRDIVISKHFQSIQKSKLPFSVCFGNNPRKKTARRMNRCLSTKHMPFLWLLCANPRVLGFFNSFFSSFLLISFGQPSIPMPICKIWAFKLVFPRGSKVVWKCFGFSVFGQSLLIIFIHTNPVVILLFWPLVGSILGENVLGRRMLHWKLHSTYIIRSLVRRLDGLTFLNLRPMSCGSLKHLQVEAVNIFHLVTQTIMKMRWSMTI